LSCGWSVLILFFPPRLGEPEGVEKRLIANLDILRKAYNLQIVVKCRHQRNPSFRQIEEEPDVER